MIIMRSLETTPNKLYFNIFYIYILNLIWIVISSMTLGFLHANRLLYGIQSLPWLLKSLKHCVCICSESPFLLSFIWTFQFIPSRYMQFLSSAPVFFRKELPSFFSLRSVFSELCAIHPAFTSLFKSSGYLWSDRICKLCSDIFPLLYIIRGTMYRG